jgi:hypothetical protein
MSRYSHDCDPSEKEVQDGSSRNIHVGVGGSHRRTLAGRRRTRKEAARLEASEACACEISSASAVVSSRVTNAYEARALEKWPRYPMALIIDPGEP